MRNNLAVKETTVKGSSIQYLVFGRTPEFVPSWLVLGVFDAPGAGVIITLIRYTLHAQLKTAHISLQSKLWVGALIPAPGAVWSCRTGLAAAARLCLQ